MKTDSIYAILITLLLISCERQDEVALCASKSEIEFKIEQKLTEFYQAISADSRNVDKVDVTSVSAKTYEIINDTVIAVTNNSRSTSDDTFEITTATINIGGQDGYAILSTDERIDQVFFFTERGELSDSCQISALKSFLDIIPLTAANILLNGLPELPTAISRSGEIVIVPTLCRFMWGQGYPFNRSMPVCSDLASNLMYCGHYPAGCVTTAVCQMLATFGEFSGYVYRNSSINFDNLPVYGYEATESQSAQLGYFFREVAMCCQVCFGINGTGALPQNIYNYLSEMEYDCEYASGQIDIGKLILELTSGIPHIICGYRTNGEGHAWIIDGLKIINGTYAFHSNWGWNGCSNGFSIGTPYAMEGSQFSQNLKHIYTYGTNN